MRWECYNRVEIQDGGRLGCSCISVDFLWDKAEAGCLIFVFSEKLGVED